jgi:hypothetical protein
MLLLAAAIIPLPGQTHFTPAYSVLYRWTPAPPSTTCGCWGPRATAKEVKIFGLGGHLSQQYSQISTDIYNENKTSR